MRAKFQKFLNSDGSILRAQINAAPRVVGVANGHGETTFYMYPAWCGEERCEVSHFTLRFLQKARKSRDRQPRTYGK
jgi:hypothetical protein